MCDQWMSDVDDRALEDHEDERESVASFLQLDTRDPYPGAMILKQRGRHLRAVPDEMDAATWYRVGGYGSSPDRDGQA